MKTEEQVIEALSTIEDYSNSMSKDSLSNIMTEFLRKEHRTLQQIMIKSIIQVIVNYSKFNTDGRNEYSVNTAKKIAESIKDELYNEKYFAPFV